MPKPPATDADVIQLTDELTWMGGNAGAMASLLSRKQFTREHIQTAIGNAMSRHSCVSTYHAALACQQVLEAALAELDRE
ncbi:MAG: hypothetical protein NW223_18855 [Hyphomicrobiaceae bacterium]|nr:hypothetical protein [Hyphomicrobiaceae bacterium]